jgi:hypothetical protein
VEEGGGALTVEGTGEVVALPVVAAEGAELGQLVRGFGLPARPAGQVKPRLPDGRGGGADEVESSCRWGYFYRLPILCILKPYKGSNLPS